MVASAAQQFGRIDVLINNAGNAGPAVIDESSVKPFWETGPQDWARWMATNFYGVLNCCHAVVPGMLARKGGRIITMVSDAGRVGEPHLAVYSGAKAGAAGFMRGLARAVAHAGVTANCIALGATRTPGIEPMIADPENVKKMLRGYLIRRLGEPADAAAMILFLASDAGGWITGQTYPVNGGYSLAA
jgi:3-oxoacyl-[acyl-carrier protein] reductase